MFNIYWVDAGDRRYIEEYIDERARYETVRSCGFVIAETRAKAKARHIKEEASGQYCKIYLEFTDRMSIKKVKGGFETRKAAQTWLQSQYDEAFQVWDNDDLSHEQKLEQLHLLAEAGNPTINEEGYSR